MTLWQMRPASSWALCDILQAGLFHNAHVKIEQPLVLIALSWILQLAPAPTLLQKMPLIKK